jgi:hypothetical protein
MSHFTTSEAPPGGPNLMGGGPPLSYAHIPGTPVALTHGPRALPYLSIYNQELKALGCW